MSCKHGNWPPCDLCDEEDAAFERGVAAGAEKLDGLLLLLRECDAAIGMLSTMPPVMALRSKISDALKTGSTPPSEPVQGDPSGALRPEPEAAGQGRWIAVTERMPENDDEVLVWVTSPWAKTAYAAIDSWHMHREDPTGMGGPTLEMGYMWREYEAEDITHWQRVEPPQAASGERGD